MKLAYAKFADLEAILARFYLAFGAILPEPVALERMDLFSSQPLLAFEAKHCAAIAAVLGPDGWLRVRRFDGTAYHYQKPVAGVLVTILNVEDAMPITEVHPALMRGAEAGIDLSGITAQLP